jgi:hypothetical protein
VIRDIDVRAVLPAIHVATLVIQRLSDRITPPCHGRYLASRIAGARYFEQPGDHSLRFAGSGDNEALYAEIAGFLAATSHPGDPDRVLATILHAKTALGSSTVKEVIRGHRGRLIRTTAAGDPVRGRGPRGSGRGGDPDPGRDPHRGGGPDRRGHRRYLGADYRPGSGPVS